MTALFLGGADRSGTTLVADLVGTHANVSPIYDTEFVVSLLTLILGDHTPSKAALPERVLVLMERWMRGFVAKQQGRLGERYQHGSQYFLFRRRVVMDETKRLLQNLNRGADPTIALRRMITVLFDMHARSDGKLKWLNKTPAYVDVLPELGAVFPEMRFIHCLRDGRDVVASIVAQPWGPNTIEEATQWWASKVRAGQRFGKRHPTRYFEVRFEDLLAAPEFTLSRAFAFLGEARDATELVSEYERRFGFDIERTCRWVEWSDAQLETFDRYGGELLDELGYSLRAEYAQITA